MAYLIKNPGRVLTMFLVFSCEPVLAGLELPDLLDMVSVTPPARVAFEEERHNALFSEPLIISGHLDYLGPRKLRKVIEQPFRESFLIDERNIEVERNGEVKKLPLRMARSLQTMLMGIEALLSGEGDRISDVFDYTIEGDKNDWSMSLVPQSRRISKHLEKISIRGTAGFIESVRFDLESGEWHLLKLDIDSDGQ